LLSILSGKQFIQKIKGKAIVFSTSTMVLIVIGAKVLPPIPFAISKPIITMPGKIQQNTYQREYENGKYRKWNKRQYG
tara:strand:+ start:87 stop:320 length:234 start_codon:yes stop_codon:yes gene_type:complete